MNSRLRLPNFDLRWHGVMLPAGDVDHAAGHTIPPLSASTLANNGSGYLLGDVELVDHPDQSRFPLQGQYGVRSGIAGIDRQLDSGRPIHGALLDMNLRIELPEYESRRRRRFAPKSL
jgi:hypothetical protein